MLVMHPSFLIFKNLRIRNFFFLPIGSSEFSFYLVSENLMLRPKSCVVVG